MNKESTTLFKELVTDILSTKGLSEKNYNIVVEMLKVDKGLCMEMHDTLNNVTKNNNHYYTNNE